MAGQQRLNLEDLYDVYGELYEVRTQWRLLGGILRVGPANLDAIGAQYRDIPDDCLRETLSHWLRQVNPLPTWKAIVDALRSPAMKQAALAQTLEGRHCPDGGGGRGGGHGSGAGVAVAGGGDAARAKDGYKKLLKRKGTIVDYLAGQKVTTQLASDLHSAGCISKAVYDQAGNYAPGVVETSRVTVVFDAVLASVKLKAARYITFLDVLKGIEGLDDLVEVIDEPLD